MNYSEAFVYKWTDTTTEMWYIGYHKGSIDDGYICSSKIVKPLIEANPGNWERTIIAHGTKQAMIDLERELLMENNAKRNSNSYNKHNGNGQALTGKPKGSGNKITVNRLLIAIEKKAGKSFWTLAAEHYYETVKSGDIKMANKYRKMFYKFMRMPKQL